MQLSQSISCGWSKLSSLILILVLMLYGHKEKIKVDQHNYVTRPLSQRYPRTLVYQFLQ